MQNPFVQVSVGTQQGRVAHDWFVLAHHEPVHVPWVAPGATSQLSPVQQSSSFVHELPGSAHGGRHTPAVHVPEQQSAPVTQPLVPSGAHAGHVPPVQVPAQHGSPPLVQALPGRTHAGGGCVAAQRQPTSTPT